MPPFADVACSLALRAGEILRRHFGRLRGLEYKGEVDLVTAADREAERLIVEGLKSEYPSHSIVAEETGERVGTPEMVWYVDPLDGTTNFVHTMPHFSVTIALAVQGRLHTAVVHDPIRNETFQAIRGAGASLNGAPIRVSSVGDPRQALVATGFPYDRRQALARYLPAFARVLQGVQGVRRAGSAALDLAWVACGRLDGYWEYGLKPWDTAGGALLVREAGGIVDGCDAPGAELPYDSIVATNGLVHDALRSLVSG